MTDNAKTTDSSPDEWPLVYVAIPNERTTYKRGVPSADVPQPRFDVFMHERLEVELENGLLGDIHRDDLYRELPLLHPRPPELTPRRRHRKRVHIFRGRFDSSNLGFTYVQVGRCLHIVEFWIDGSLLEMPHTPYQPTKVDVVIGTPRPLEEVA